MRKKSLSLLRFTPLAVLFVCGVAAAQTEAAPAQPAPEAVAPKPGTITGVVTDASSGGVVAGAVVIATSPALKGAEQTAVTDGSGKFSFANLPPGDYKLAVQLGGYKPFERADLVVKADTTLRASLTVVPEAVQMEEVVVTGSRVKRMDLTAPAPVDVVNREQLVESGRISIGDYLQLLPQQTASPNQQVNNGGDGSFQVNLRGLGPSRTLVLLNGRRLVKTSGTGAAGSAVDLNTIPLSAIERVEVLPDGASSIYGSDAIAGVVNIITKRNYSGTNVVAQYGISGYGDGASWDVQAQTGTSGDAGSVFFGAEYFHQNAIYSSARSWSNQVLGYSADAALDGPVGPYPFGSGSIPQGYFTLFNQSGGQLNGSAPYGGMDPASLNPFTKSLFDTYWVNGAHPTSFVNDPTGKVCETDPNGNKQCWRPRNSATDLYNYQSVNYLLTPLQKINIFTAGDAKLSNWARAYFEGQWANRSSSQDLAPEPLYTAQFPGVAFQVDPNSVYNPTGLPVYARKRMVEWGFRQQSQNVDTYRLVLGADGKFGSSGTLPEPFSTWTWDTSLNFGRSDYTQVSVGSTNTLNAEFALGPSFKDATGYHCGTPSNVLAGCVPLNMFSGVNSSTTDQQAYSSWTGPDYGFNQIVDYQLNVQGEIAKLWSTRAMAFATGYEFINEAGQFIPNPISNNYQSFDYNVHATPFTNYFQNDAYFELVIPILNNIPFVDDLEATGSFRFSDYSNFGTNWSWKVGGRYRPVPDITLRGTYSTAFRSPNIQELAGGTFSSAETAKDPCSAIGPGTSAPVGSATYNNCIKYGGPGMPTTGTGDTSAQFNGNVGGNPNLKPETAKVWTAGFVFEPTFWDLKGLTLTADYWSYVVTNAIEPVGAPSIFAFCYTYSPNYPQYCNAIQRDPKTGFIIQFNDPFENIGQDSTAGVDLALKYTRDTNFGKWNFLWQVTWLNYFDKTYGNGQTDHIAGTYDYGSTNNSYPTGLYPKWKFNILLSWNWKDILIAYQNHFINSFTECDGSNLGAPADFNYTYAQTCFNNPWVPGVSGYRRTVSAWDSSDIYVSYTLRTSVGNTLFGFGINNIFNAKPPVIYTAFAANSDPGYDWVGTYYYFRVGQSF